MKTMIRLTLALGLALPLAASAVLFTSDTHIALNNSTYDGQDIVVSNATLTVDGTHTFASLLVAEGGKLTHTFSPNGLITQFSHVSDEPQLLTGTNEVVLAGSNIVAASVVVTDMSGTSTYTNNTDYMFTLLSGQGFLARTEASSIPNGSMVLVSYDVPQDPVDSGVDLVISGDVEIVPGAAIDVARRGYSNSWSTGRGGTEGYPPSGGGGGYIGKGGVSSGNGTGGAAPSGSFTLGGAGGSGVGGPGATGGGRVRIQCGGTFLLNGDITANGDNALSARAGGGAGGSVDIVATNLVGNGTISVNGGAGEPVHGGGGGGGYVSLETFTNTFTGMVTAYGGAGWQHGGAGEITLRKIGEGGSHLIDNGGNSGAETAPTVNVGYDLIVQGGATASLVYSGNGILLGSLVVRSNSVVRSVATSNAGLYLTINSNAVVEPGGAISVSGLGWPANSGSGAGGYGLNLGGGAGHGGYGGNGIFGSTNANGGSYYGSITSPNLTGSGGRTVMLPGGAGGGYLRLVVAGNLQVDGEISCDATAGSGDRSGGGSGGSIWIATGGFFGSGRISANGGAGGLPYGGGGAGGRIAVYYASNSFTGDLSAAGAAGAVAGGAGTIYLKADSEATGDFIADNGGLRGARTVLNIASLRDFIAINGAQVTNSTSMTCRNFLLGSNSVLAGGYTYLTVNVASNMVIETNATLIAYGYYGGSSFRYAGGSHGGAGGRGYIEGAPAPLTDSASAPTMTGQGGGYGAGGQGAFGGGRLTITTRSLRVDGTISASGNNAYTNLAGGGAGGTIALTFNGSAGLTGTGSIVADGGDGDLPNGGGGGGGRIAITAPTNSFTGTISAKGGAGYEYGGAGTVYITDYRSNARLVVDNGGNTGSFTYAAGTGSVDLSVQGGARIGSFGTYVPSFRNLFIAANSLITTNGNFTVLANATIEAGGGFAADGLGTSAGSGVGSSGNQNTLAGGGGHGGFGGANSSGGSAYGVVTAPTTPGSRGGYYNSSSTPGGNGGGSLRLTVFGTLHLDGAISANGLDGTSLSGGGSGGSVHLILNRFEGTGQIAVTGGSSSGGGGGGGRIAVTWNPTLVGNSNLNLFTGSIMAHGGTGLASGGAGTVYLKRNDQPRGTVVVDNFGIFGTNTPALGMPAANWDLFVRNGGRLVGPDALSTAHNIAIEAGGEISSMNSTLTLTVGNSLSVAADGVIRMDGRGAAAGAGTGAGENFSSKGAGGGYGGMGGSSASGALGGTNYGSATQPVDVGSGGGEGLGQIYDGSEGGGAIRLMVPGTLALDGLISACGTSGLGDDSGGGSGGSIWVTANSLAGGGVFAADGGDGELYGGGGGGGGRIAVYVNNTNAFSGGFSVLGGDGAAAGQNGTILFSTNMLPLVILGQSPSGIVSNTVGDVYFIFSSLLSATSVTADAFVLIPPPGSPLPATAAMLDGSSGAHLSITPALNVSGEYTVVVAPTITDLFGAPMSQSYTGVFTVALPEVQGYVRDTNSAGVAGVTVSATSLPDAVTDGNGFYSVGVPPGWTGSLTPAFGPNMFVPGAITISNLVETVTNQNFLMVDTIAPNLVSQASGTNLLLNWAGLDGVMYQPLWSTNLIEWMPWGDAVPGTNGLQQLAVPMDGDPAKFFQFQATH